MSFGEGRGDGREEQLVGGGEPEAEPIYGPTYLPRKIQSWQLGFLRITV